MKKFCFTPFRPAAFLGGMLVLLLSVVFSDVAAQPWSYTFATGIGTFTSTTASETFLPTPPTGGGKSRVRNASMAGGASINLDNPGLAGLGSDSELRIVGTSNASVAKFSIYNYTASKEGYIKFSVVLGGTATSGQTFFAFGDGAFFSDNNQFNATALGVSFGAIRWTWGSGTTINLHINSGSSLDWVATGLTNSTTTFVKGTTHTVEMYYNNTTSSKTYSRGGGSHTLTNNKWDLWVDGSLVGEDLVKAGLANNVNVDSYCFHSESSNNAALTYLDDLEYSNALPVATPTISTTGTPSAVSTTYGTASASSSFSVSGADMEAGITVTPPAGFEVSTDNVTFSNTVVVGAAGTIASTTVHIRLKADATPSSYSGNIVLSSTNATSVDVAMPSSTVNTKELTITGVTANNKPYDGNTTASLSGTATLVGVVGMDDVTLSGAPMATFASANAAMGIAVSVSGYTLSGAQASFYTLQQPQGLTANITPASQTITFDLLPTKLDNDPDFNLTATATSGLTVTYTSSNTAVATISGNTVDIVGVGMTTITASQAGDGNYGAAPNVAQVLTVNSSTLQDQTITFDPLANVTYGDADFNLTATATSGLTVTYMSSNTAVATISGSTVTIVGAGTTTITASQAGNGTYNPAPDVTQDLTVLPKNISLVGATAHSKVYDATTSIAISGGTLNGIVGMDEVTVVYSNGGTVANINVGNNKPVTTNLSLTGADAVNYFLVQPNDLVANITPATLTVSGLTADDKIYDASNVATLSGTLVLNGLFLGDDVTGTPTATFNNKNVGTDKPVTVTVTLDGAESGNYQLTPPAPLAADITPAALSVNGLAAENKVYDATDAASLTGTAMLAGVLGMDNVTLGGSGTGTFNNKNVGTAKPVTVTGFSISGADAGNYTLSQPTGLTADITAASLTISGLNANDKPYDGTTTATLSGTATLNGVISPDVVTLGGTPTATFASANAGMGIAVNVSGYTLSGLDAGNYTLTQPQGLTATIEKADQTITFAALPTKLQSDAPFNLTATATSGLAVTYASSNTDVATISGNTVTIVGAGTTTITASQAGDSNYEAADDVAQNLVVTGVLAAWDFDGKAGNEASVNATFQNSKLEISAIQRGSGLAGAALANIFNSSSFSTASTNATAAATANDFVYFNLQAKPGYQFSAGTLNANFRRSNAGPNNFQWQYTNDGSTYSVIASSIAFSSTVTNGVAQTPISLTSITNLQDAKNATVRLLGWGATDNGGIFGIGRLAGNDLLITGEVTCLVPTAYNMTGGGAYCDMAGVPVGLDGSDVGISYQLLLNDNPVGTPVTGTGSAISFGNQTVVGTYTVEATNNIDDCNEVTTQMGSAVVSITTPPEAPTGSGTQAFYKIDNKKVADLVAVGDNIKWYDAATAGNLLPGTTLLMDGTNYYASQTVGICESTDRLQVTVELLLSTQTITFNELPVLTTVHTPLTLNATASSGLTVTYTSSNDAVATISGNTLTIVGAGTAIITALQGGDANYLPAEEVQRTLTVEAPLVHWNFTAGTANPNFTNSNLTATAISQGNNNGTTTLITSTSASSGYLGASGTNNAGAAARTGALVTGTNGSAYFEFTLTPLVGRTITLTGLYHGSRSTGTGPQAYSLRSSADSYAANLVGGNYLANSVWALSTNLDLSSTLSNDPMTYRLFGFGGTGSPSTNTANWRIDDVVLTGTITCNTPAAYGVTGGGTYCAGGTGLAIGLENSELGMSYQLQLNSEDIGTPVSGTGGAISFGNQTAAGTYTVVAKNLNGTCNVSTNQLGSKTISITLLPAAPTGSTPQVFCSTDNATIADLTVTGTAILWYDAATDGNLLPTTTALTNGGIYYASQTVDGCEGSDRLAVTANITPATTYYADADMDTYGNASVTTLACATPMGYVANNTDCDDNNGNIYPEATEVCNGLDDDCDTVVDEGFTAIQTTAAITNTGCGGVAIGAIDLTVTQGTAVEFAWSNGAITEDISSLGTGDYTVIVTSDEGCTGAATYTVGAAAGLNATFYVIHVTCFGSSNGTIFTAPSGGVAPYTYLWSNGKTARDINLLSANTYTLTMTDSDGCSTTFNVDVEQPTALNFTFASSGAGPYQVTISATGGTPAYTYGRTGITGFQNSNIFENVPAGTYVFRVKDANNCQKSRITKVPIVSPKPGGTVIADRGEDLFNAAAPTAAQLFVFPNPADEVLHLELLDREYAAGQLRITDLTGRVLLEKTVQMFENEAQTLSVAKFAPGMYQVIFVENTGAVLAKNFVVTH